jgi:hypothetical protein
MPGRRSEGSFAKGSRSCPRAMDWVPLRSEFMHKVGNMKFKYRNNLQYAHSQCWQSHFLSARGDWH